MNIEYQKAKSKGPAGQATVIFISAGADEAVPTPELRTFRHLYLPHLKSGAFKAGRPEVLPLSLEGKSWLLLAGLGETSESGLLEASSRAAAKLNALEIRKAAMVVPAFSLDDDLTLAPMTIGLTLAMDRRGVYKTSDHAPPKSLEKVTFLDYREKAEPGLAKAAISRARVIAQAQLRARELTDRPANLLYPEAMAEEALALGRDGRFKVTVWDDKRLSKEGAGAILAVGGGSVHTPRMVVAEYQGPGVKNRTRPTALVGKGVTFDSGGLCLKPAENMSQMKTDMAGAAAVLSAIAAASDLALPVSLTAVIPLAENLPSGSACRPGDVVRTLSGRSVEIMNTDAEGRLILCDALTLAQRYKPSRIIDLATLTGACQVALGESCAGLFSNDAGLADLIVKTGRSVGEDYWPLPLYEPYDDKLKSELADLRESSGRLGGAIIAALFLRRFIDGGLPWVHLDIVGTARNSKSRPSCPEGATGFGVRTLIGLLASETAAQPGD